MADTRLKEVELVSQLWPDQEVSVGPDTSGASESNELHEVDLVSQLWPDREVAVGPNTPQTSESKQPYEGEIFVSKNLDFWDVRDPATANRHNVTPDYYFTFWPVTRAEACDTKAITSLLHNYQEEISACLSLVEELAVYRHFSFELYYHESSKMALLRPVPEITWGG
jgi:hypothetical protein